MARQRNEPEDSNGMELPSIAPTEGVQIVEREGLSPNTRGIKRGVKIIGGGVPRSVIEKGVSIVSRHRRA